MGKEFMNEKFKFKLEERLLYDKLINIRVRVQDVYKQMGFLNNYCKAYSFQDGICYFAPFVEFLTENAEKIADDLASISVDSCKKKPQLWDGLKPIDFSEDYTIED